MENIEEIIIDTDCGVDDSLALLLALSRHGKDANIRAITCCRGVTNVNQVSSNVLRILNYVGLQQIPVYVGCEKPLLDNAHYETSFHGQDGLGGVSSSLPLGSDQKVERQPASVALVDLVAQKPGSISLLTLGPLTNVAIAQRLDPKFSANLKQLTVMGGSLEGLGNQTPLAEFNFYVDPEAAQMVLLEFQCPVTIYPWEPCANQPLPWSWFDNWTKKSTRVANLLNKITEKSRTWDLDHGQLHGYLVPDLFAAACALFPKMAVESSKKAVGLNVELVGKHSRGMMILDRRNQPRKGEESSNVTVVTKINMENVLVLLEDVTEDSWIKS